MQASTGLPWTTCNSSPKKVCENITLNYHNYYIGQSHFKLPFSHVLYAIATVLLHKLPNTNMHIVTSMLSQVHESIKKPNISRSIEAPPLPPSSLGPASRLTFSLHAFSPYLITSYILQRNGNKKIIIKYQQYIYLPI